MARRRRKRHREREQFWRQVLEEWQAGGQSVSAFYRERRLWQASFYAWRRRLASTRQGPVFAPVRVIPDAGVESPVPAIEVALASGRVVRIHPGFDPATLGRVLAVLEGRPC